MVRPVALVLSLALLAGLAGCGDDGGDGAGPTTGGRETTTAPPNPGWLDSVTTAPTTPAGLGEGWGERRDGRTPLDGFGEVAATVTAADGTVCELCLLTALTSAQQTRGLMFVTDEELGGYDGMVFVFEADTTGGFWMRNTRLPLSIAYFDGEGVLVSQTDMAPCPDDEECPGYPAEGPFRYALEVPQGRLEELGVRGLDGGPAAARDAVLQLTGTPCPALADPAAGGDDPTR